MPRRRKFDLYRCAQPPYKAVTRMQGYSLRSFPSLHILNSLCTPEWRPENSLRDEAIQCGCTWRWVVSITLVTSSLRIFNQWKLEGLENRHLLVWCFNMHRVLPFKWIISSSLHSRRICGKLRSHNWRSVISCDGCVLCFDHPYRAIS